MFTLVCSLYKDLGSSDRPCATESRTSLPYTMPAEPSPQCSKTPLLLTSHLCLDPPNALLRPTFIFTYLSFPSACYVFLDLKCTVQLQSSSLYTFLHHLLLHLFWVRSSCSFLCPQTCSVYDFPLTMWVPASHPYKISRSRYGPDFRFLPQCTWGFMLFWDVMQVDWEFVTYFWENLSVPSSRVKHQDPWKWKWQVIPKGR